MMIAQRLYESGLITYMRTDSVNLSDLALGTAKEAIFETYGEKYYKFRQYHTKSKGAQEAHEAIRPTYISNVEAGSSSQEKKLYELIRKRTIACQMADAELERTTISVGISGQTERFVAVGEVISFEGFLQVYMESNDDDTEKEQENGLLPPVKLHETLSLKDIVATERFTQRPPRYTEASLVRRLEELGIGRPSTRAAIIETLFKRHYIRKERKNLIATPTGVELIGLIHEELLKSAELTGIWEKKLREIERKSYDASTFLDELKQMVAEVVHSVLSDNTNRRVTTMEETVKEEASKKTAAKRKASPRKPKAATKEAKPENPPADEWVGKPCPLCGKGTIIKGKTAYGCSEWKNGCTFRKPF